MKNKKIYIIFSFLLSFLSIGLANKTLENDTFSAIKIGEYILKHGVDFKEHLNEFNTLNYHNARWLFNVIISFLNDHFGFIGIYILVMIVSILIALSIFNILLKKKLNIYISFFLTVITMIFLRGFLVPRAQIFSYLFLVLEIFFIERILSDNKKLDYIWLFIIGVLFANIHTTLWLMSLIVILPYFAEYFLSKFKMVKKIKFLCYDDIDLKRLIFIFILVLITGFVTPLGLLPFTYMVKTLKSLKETINIVELQPLTLSSFFGAYFIVYIIMIVSLIYNRLKFRISDVFMIAGLGILAVDAVRNLPMFFAIVILVIGSIISKKLTEYSDKEKIVMDRITKMNYITIFIAVVTVIASSYMLYSNIKTKYVDITVSPVKIADYLNDNPDNNRIIFNDFNTGAYLEYRNIKAFIDSRSEIYCKEFNDTSIMKDYNELVAGSIHYEKVFKKYGITHVIAPNQTGIDVYISKDKNYKKILKEDYYTLYEKIQ